MTSDEAQFSTEMPTWAKTYLDQPITLQELGEMLGITREAARLRLKKLGITPRGQGEIAGIRAEQATAKLEQEAANLETTFPGVRDLLLELAQKHTLREEAVSRILHFYPDMNKAVLLKAMKQWSIAFPTANLGESIFSDAALKGALLYIVGIQQKLQPDLQWGLLNLDSQLIDEVSNILGEAEIGSTEIANILGIIAATLKKSTENSVSITGKDYDSLRQQVLSEMGIASGKGTTPWPPTRQTFMKRFGGWNEALQAMGFAATAQGRPKGLLHFTHENYTSAIEDYLAYCLQNEISTTFQGYANWFKLEKEAGNKRPSGASIRNYFGSWNEALLAESTEFSTVTPTRSVLPSFYSEEEYVSALEKFLAYCQESGTAVQYLTYQNWTREQREKGIQMPSSGSVQKHFGTWNNALQAVSTDL